MIAYVIEILLLCNSGVYHGLEWDCKLDFCNTIQNEPWGKGGGTGGGRGAGDVRYITHTHTHTHRGYFVR